MDDDILNKRYKIGKVLGHGAYGIVSLVKDINTNEKYAIKQISKAKIGSEYLINSLKKELQLMRIMSDKHSVKIIDDFETEDNYNFVLELCDTDLDIVLTKRKKGFNELELHSIMNQFNKIFKKMRQNQIIHRDLKLKNILVKYDKNIPIIGFILKLSDYGFSKELRDQDVTSTQLGSPHTQAPEISMGKYTAKVDLWSIGVIIYQLLFKQLPFAGVRTREELERVKKAWVKVSLPKNNNNPITSICFDLIDKLMQKDPNKRIDFEDYFNHKFFSEEHKNELLNVYKKTTETKIEQNDNDNKKNNIKKNNLDILEIFNFDKEYKKLFLIKDYNNYKLYKGKNLKKNKNVYIKEIPRSVIDNNNENKKIFDKENELLSTLKGSQFPEYFGFSKNNSYYYIIIEYFNGNILEDFINSHHNNLNQSLLTSIFNKLGPSFSEIKKKNISLESLSLKSFAFTFYQNETNFEIKFFDYGLNSIIKENDKKKYKTIGEILSILKLVDFINSNQDNKNKNNYLDEKEPIIKDDDIENLLLLTNKKIEIIFNYFKNIFDKKDNIDNEIYSCYYNEIIIFLYFCSLECQTIIKILNINADIDLSKINENEQEIHLFQIINKLNKSYKYSFINLINESRDNYKYVYNKENPTFDYFLKKFKDLKKNIDNIFNKFINNNNFINENNQNNLDNGNNNYFFISITDYLKNEDNSSSSQIYLIKNIIEKSLKEGNLDKLFMKIFENAIFKLSYEKKEKNTDELYITKYLIEYIILLRAMDVNKETKIEFDEILKNNNEKESSYFVSFIGGIIKLLKEKNNLSYNNNEKYYNLNEVELKELNLKVFEKFINFYTIINQLIDNN